MFVSDARTLLLLARRVFPQGGLAEGAGAEAQRLVGSAQHDGRALPACCARVSRPIYSFACLQGRRLRGVHQNQSGGRDEETTSTTLRSTQDRLFRQACEAEASRAVLSRAGLLLPPGCRAVIESI